MSIAQPFTVHRPEVKRSRARRGAGRRSERRGACHASRPSRTKDSQPAALVAGCPSLDSGGDDPARRVSRGGLASHQARGRITPPHSEHWRRGMSRNSIGIRSPDCSAAPPAPAGRADDERDPKPRRQAVTAPLERLVRLVFVFLPASHGGPHRSYDWPDSDHPIGSFTNCLPPRR